MIAIDASALLAFLFRETGHEKVGGRLPESCLSTVNLAEVLGRFTHDGHDPLRILDQLRRTGLEIVPFVEEQAAMAAALLPLVRSKGLSLGDRACLSLAASRRIPALTADRAWAGLRVGIEISLIR